jgi:hypothetical protein
LFVGGPLWLSGKVVKNEKIMKSRGPGFAPHPGQPLKKTLFVLIRINIFVLRLNTQPVYNNSVVVVVPKSMDRPTARLISYPLPFCFEIIANFKFALLESSEELLSALRRS